MTRGRVKLEEHARRERLLRERLAAGQELTPLTAAVVLGVNQRVAASELLRLEKKLEAERVEAPRALRRGVALAGVVADELGEVVR